MVPYHEIWVPRGMILLRQAAEKNIHYIWFSRFTLTE